MKKQLWYFGCIGTLGHYWFGQPKSYYGPVIPGINKRIWERFDATYPPADTTEGLYNDIVIQHVRIVSWWDNSVDKRVGSNSNLVGIGYESAEEMLTDAETIFPEVMKRQPRPKPVKLITPCQ